ncbi:hypothetical protein HG15A2_14660 [Adhaeretor mobilis]|uniref:Uncharacterized protein n=1 Tax=Adhaeretor mobilis TaxID=1930276 RepID=A0A517MTI1_9BACT|nr:hypothetical protein HG15A2_14660 [Adhaeretor mobilis]
MTANLRLIDCDYVSGFTFHRGSLLRLVHIELSQKAIPTKQGPPIEVRNN